MFLGHLLNRVVVLPQDNDWTCRPQALQFFDDGAVLQFVVPDWRFEGDNAVKQENWPRFDFELSDDLGTPYRSASGSTIGTQMGDDGRTSLHGRFIFTPAVPAEAGRVTISGNEGDISVTIE